MRRVKLFLMAVLSATCIYLAGEVYYKWTLLLQLEDKSISSYEKIPQQIKLPAKNAKINKSRNSTTTPFEKDIRWSKTYSKQGDRTVRYTYNSTLPFFKKKYNNWQGKQYIEKSKLEQIAFSIITRLPHIKDDPNVVNLVVETAIAESSGGFNIKSSKGDHGVFQIRLEVAEETLEWLKYNHKDVYDITIKFKNKNSSLEENLDRNIPFGAALCISEYWRKAGPRFTDHIKTTKDRAIMWKSVYNTRKGEGTVHDYITRNKIYERIVAQRNQKSS